MFKWPGTAGYYDRLDLETLKTFRIGAVICLIITLWYFGYKIILLDIYFENGIDGLDLILCLMSLVAETDAIIKTSARIKKKT